MYNTGKLYKLDRQFNDFDINLQGHIFYLMCIDVDSESLTTLLMIDLSMLSDKLHMNELCTYQKLSKFVAPYKFTNIDAAEQLFVDFCKSNNLCLSYIDDEHLVMIQFWYDDTTNVIDGFGNVVPIEPIML